MMRNFILALLLGSGLADEAFVADYDRACPEGFFYAGEADGAKNEHLTRDIYWEKGDTSPIYSCYKFMKDQNNFVDATLSCNELFEGQLLSINDSLEDVILSSNKFLHFLPEELLEELNVTGETSEVLTSGIELAEGSWTWFGAGEPVDKKISSIIEENTDNETNTVQCLSIRWENRENTTILVYSSVPCIHGINATICEVKVYTQMWYAWIFTNWLQILFFVTLSVLLMSSCCMFQALFFRNARSRQQARPMNAPPAYSPNPPVYTYNNDNYRTKANKYMQKGKEVLSKVSLNKPKDDDQVHLSTA